MRTRKWIGVVAFIVLIITGFVIRFWFDIDPDEWHPLGSLAYVIALCITLIMAFYDPKDLPKKTFDYNPRRGLQYFLFGWIIFPVLLGIEAYSKANLSIETITVGTLVMSIFVGVIGMFTENVGI